MFIQILTVCVLICGAALANAPAAAGAPGNWREYAAPEAGFAISLPGPPEVTVIPTADGSITAYQLTEPDTGLIRYSVFVGRPIKGVYETDSMNAHLDGKLKGMLSFSVNAKLTQSQRTTFQGYPANVYRFEHDMAEGIRYVGRGVEFMIDGGSIKISMQHPLDDADADAKYAALVASFRLTPVAYSPSGEAETHLGISVTPPKGWLVDKRKTSFDIANFHQLTRSIGVLAAGDAAYGCSKFEADLKATFGTSGSAVVQIAGRSFAHFRAAEPVPKYNVVLRHTHYCLDTAHGAVAVRCTAEDTEADRWGDVCRGTAATLRIHAS